MKRKTLVVLKPRSKNNNEKTTSKNTNKMMEHWEDFLLSFFSIQPFFFPLHPFFFGHCRVTRLWGSRPLRHVCNQPTNVFFIPIIHIIYNENHFFVCFWWEDTIWIMDHITSFLFIFNFFVQDRVYILLIYVIIACGCLWNCCWYCCDIVVLYNAWWKW